MSTIKYKYETLNDDEEPVTAQVTVNLDEPHLTELIKLVRGELIEDYRGGMESDPPQGAANLLEFALKHGLVQEDELPG